MANAIVQEYLLEHYDPEDVLNAKIDELASYLMHSNHTVFFTGAGISTSAGIADYRSSNGTCNVYYNVY